jgi:chorismate lyase/3-hydroxybenzoate synthase
MGESTPHGMPTRRFTSARLPGTLATIRHGADAGPPDLVAGVPVLRVPTATGSTVTETWTVTGTIRSGLADGMVFAHNDEHLFVAGRIAPAGRYAEATTRAYSAAFDLALSLGFRRLYRMWNRVQDINADNDCGTEIYRDFCAGRAEAFDRHRRHGITMPAATAVGSCGGGISFHLLAARRAGVAHLENPNQVPAHHYPPRYGPRPPSFARASWLSDEPGHGVLHISGTAGIIGHQSVHTGDAGRQCDVALANIATLVGRANTDRHGLSTDLKLTDLRSVQVYVRHPHDLATVRARCAAALPPAAEPVYLVADICRRELLVEIEGAIPVGHRPSTVV